MLVQQILSAKPDHTIITIRPDALVSEAVSLLSTRRIGALVVSRDGQTIAGIVSERDIVRELGRTGPSILQSQVDSLMTRKIVTCEKTDSARDVVERMTQGRFRHMPVVEGGRMIGLISIGDVVKWRLDELTMQRDALEGMIKGH